MSTDGVVRCSLLAAALAFLPANLLISQETSASRKHNLTLGGGAAVPGGDVGKYVSTSGVMRIGYGYRFLRYLQADIDLDWVMGAAHVNISQQSLIGELRIRDFEYLLPFGARVILPVAGRFQLFGGGGPAYLHYAEQADIPSGITLYCPYGPCSVSVDCPSCRSRGGWGYYGTAGGDIALDRRLRVWLGLEMRVLRGTTSGESLGSVPEAKTADRWVTTTMNVTYRF